MRRSSPSAMKGRRGWRAGVEEAAVGAVHDHRDLLRRDAARDRELAERLVDGDQLVGDRRGRPGGAGDQREQRSKERRGEAVAEELRHVLVQVEQQRHAAELLAASRRSSGSRAPSPPGPGRSAGADARAPGARSTMPVKARYSAMWPANPTKARLTGRRTIRIAPSVSSAGSPGCAQADDVDLVARLHQGIALAADARVAREDRVGDDGDAPVPSPRLDLVPQERPSPPARAPTRSTPALRCERLDPP